jgi:peptidoglycan hydrolase-like protein with peptidoglycan-binding domain
MIAVLALIVSGCATTSKQAASPITTQVAELQQRVEDQEKEIVDLKYEVRELSNKDTDKTADEAVTPVNVAKSEPIKSAEPKNLDIIKVSGVSGRELQKALKAAGVYEGKIDGKVGPKTKAAVVEFQGAHSLKADGVVGQKTWNELKAYLTEGTGSSTK